MLSIFDAEAFAIFKAIQFTKKIRQLGRNEKIEIRTDALSIVNALRRTVCTDSALAPVKKEIREVFRMGINIVIVWVPSHSDIYGNDYIDRLAKKAIDASEICQVQMSVREFVE